MGKLFVLALAIAVSVGTTAVLGNSGRSARQSEDSIARMAGDGAFRDGLYVGRLAAASGRPLVPDIGRWSRESDRTSFASGYRRGYNDFLASANRTNF